MRILFSVLMALSLCACNAQPAHKVPAIPAAAADTAILGDKAYNSATFGLSMRGRPDAAAPVTYKIPYGAPVAPVKPADPNEPPPSTGADTITLDGMHTYWVKVTADNKTGYVVDAYVSDYAPPPAAAAGIREWAAATGKPYGKSFYGKPRVQTLQQDGLSVFRQLYDNGAVYSEAQGHEYICQTLQLPNTSILKVYNCIKLLKDFEDVFKANTTLRRGHYKIPGKGADEGYDWNVEYEEGGGTSWIKSISIGWSGGGYSTLTIRAAETDVLVSYSTGV